MLERVAPEAIDRFRFEIDNDDSSNDYFHLSGGGKRVTIEANSPTSAAYGLNWYLKHYCDSNISWCGDNIIIPDYLPEVEYRNQSELHNNFYMNYCTLGYSAPYWDWERWEREIDLMALNGVTIPLAMVGAEAVWLNFLQRVGFSREQSLEFLCGPAHMPWLLMANIQKVGGPMPEEWFTRVVELQRRILKRMKEFGMEPMLQGFFGMVPTSFKELYPNAKISEQGLWATRLIRPSILAPTDPLFAKMAKIWYDEYDKLFGEANYYAGDLFHEGGSTQGLDVTECARAVQESMLQYNPKAIWVLQAWHANPRAELLAGLRKDRTIVQDICSEYYMPWKGRNGYEGYDFVVGYVSNYGGNIGLQGRLECVSEMVHDALSNPVAAPSLTGTGSFPEGIEQNPVLFDLCNDLRWAGVKGVNIEKWIENYSRYRYGAQNSDVAAAWQIFLRTAYGTYKDNRRTSVSVFGALPTLEGESIKGFGQCEIYYDYRDFAAGVDLFIAEAEQFKDSETYQYDLVDFVRQNLDNLAKEEYYSFTKAYLQGDRYGFEKHSKKFLEMLLDADRLLSTHPLFHLSTWLDYARRASEDNKNSDYYEYNARLLVGTWAEVPTHIRNYAHRDYGGMLKDLYYPRWSSFIEKLSKSSEIKFVNGRESKESPTYIENEFYEQDTQWVEAKNRYSFDQSADPVATAIEIYNKWR